MSTENGLAVITKSLTGLLPYQPAKNFSFHKITYRTSKGADRTVVCGSFQIQENLITMYNIRSPFYYNSSIKQMRGLNINAGRSCMDTYHNYMCSVGTDSKYEVTIKGYRTIDSKSINREMIDDIESFKKVDPDPNKWYSKDKATAILEATYETQQGVDKTIKELNTLTSLEHMTLLNNKCLDNYKHLCERRWNRKSPWFRFWNKKPDFDKLELPHAMKSSFIKSMEYHNTEYKLGMDLTHMYEVFGGK